MEGLTQREAERIQKEAMVATFLYDALLRRKGGLPEVAIAAANEYPNAAALVEEEIWTRSLAPGLLTGASKRSVTVSRISSVPCAQAAAKASVIFARIAIFLSAIVSTAAMAAALYVTDGTMRLQEVARGVFGISESRALQVLQSLRQGDTNDSATKLLLQVERAIASARPIRALPHEYTPSAIVAAFFVLGVLGGLLFVQSVLITSYICGFLAGLLVCNLVNLCLSVSGGLTCEVKRGYRQVPVAVAQDGLREYS